MTKSIRYLLIVAIAVVFLIGAFSGGVILGWFLPRTAAASADFLPLPTIDNSSEPATTEEQGDLLAPFWEVWDIIHKQYVDQPVDDTALIRGAIRGMLDSLGDQHTAYMDPEEYRQANMQMQGDYDGIGAWVDTAGDYLQIISPMPDSPAEKAGLKPGDTVIMVDGEDMTGVVPNMVLLRVLGPAGTQVTLTIAREETTEPFDVTITRAKIVVPSVDSEMLDGGIAYVQVFNFGDKTTAELTTALKELMAQNPKGMILDLRNNGGGYLHTAIEVVSQFIPSGVVMYEEYADGSMDSYEALRKGLATKVPLVVLVNEGTASASEITAGAIQDLGRGTLVGAKTYGKGSVQNWLPLDNDDGAVRVTVARWLTPLKRQIHKVGLQPDVPVDLTEEDLQAERDPQLEKAIEILQGAK